MALETINASASPEVQINNNFDAISHCGVYARKATTTTGLTWGYWEGRWSGYSIVTGTLTLTNNTTNYITVNRSSGVISTSTLTDSWDDTTNHARVYKVTTSGGLVTGYEDHRAGLHGVHGYMQGGSGGGGGAGGGAVKLYPDATELLAESATTIGVRELNESATESTPTTLTVTVNNNTLQLGPAFENGAVNATELAGGEWTMDCYRSVDNTNGTTTIATSLYLKQAQAGTIAITGTGTSRTATVTGGTPFVAGDVNADPSKSAWIRTPNAYLRITAYTTSSVVTVECKTGYVNESGVAYSKDKYISQGVSADINDTSTAHEVVEWFFNTVACSTTDVVMIRYWAKTTASGNRVVSLYYGGETNYTHLHTTLPIVHDNLAGLNVADYQHLTAAEKTMLMKAPLGGNYNGKPTASFVMMRHPVVIPFNIPAGMSGSIAKAEVAATAQTDFDCQKNGVSFGTIRFAAAGTTATFIAGSQTSFVSGDVLKVIAPVTPDATLENIGFTFLITKVA